MNLTEEGIIILPKNYLKKKAPQNPIKSDLKPIDLPYSSKSVVLKDDWVLQPKGNLKLIHKKKI